ncbi:MAG: CDP-alcohol phosphatidyltransferase family protein, partial [Candidatus Thermoplasmatota archaeon]|nr:CDP-alcohol phosphatidyltransferase family protein [Candidatus Thermoplasmatota archaeon]
MNFPAIASKTHWPRTKRKGTAWGDVLSTFNIGLGGIALMYILDNTMVSLYSACALIFVIMALDGLDGMVARRTRSTP